MTDVTHFCCGMSVDFSRCTLVVACFSAILASTFSLGMRTTRRNNASNDRSAFAMRVLSGEAHEASAVLPSENAVGESAPEHAGQHGREPLAVSQFARVEPLDLFRDVAASPSYARASSVQTSTPGLTRRRISPISVSPSSRLTTIVRT